MSLAGSFFFVILHDFALEAFTGCSFSILFPSCGLMPSVFVLEGEGCCCCAYGPMVRRLVAKQQENLQQTAGPSPFFLQDNKSTSLRHGWFRCAGRDALAAW